MAAYVMGFAFLFSGIALLLSILLAVWLPLGLAASAVTASTIGVVLMRNAPPVDRRTIRRIIGAGLVGGVVATMSYDASRSLLSWLDPSPYNPFVPLDAFGALLLGDSADPGLRLVAGSAFHLLNGTAFGVGYCLFFGRFGAISPRAALVTGVGWGLFLETFQLTLYPGWLDIRAFEEFATISSASHIIYGGVLGLTSRSALRRLVRATPGQLSGGRLGR